jgi:hypothetical protein
VRGAAVTGTGDDLLVRPARQALLGAGLLFLGCALAVGIVQAGFNVLAGVGFVIAVWGAVLIVNGLVVARRERGGHAQPGDGSFDRVAVLALALAVVVPPAGVLLAAYRPVEGRRGQGLYALAIAIGAVLTVVYTLLIVFGAASARSDG